MSGPRGRRTWSPTAAKPSPTQLDVDCRSLAVDRLSAAATLAGADLSAPIEPRLLTAPTFDQQTVRADLQPLCWTVFDLD